MLSEYNKNSYSSSRSLFGGIDMVALGIYIAIAVIGFLCITSASYDPDTTNFFAPHHNYVKQLVWIGLSWAMATVVLLLDRRLFHMFAYPSYIAGVLLLLAVLAFGKEINGAKAWFEFGSVRLQPVEFVKITTALMMARVMSDYAFNINRLIDLIKVALIILVPFGIIVLQNDTGSGLVLGAFLFVLYREGLTKYVYFPILFTIVLFVAAMMFSPVVIFVVLLAAEAAYAVKLTLAE
jgi:rod shape determining protein RodA